MKLQQKRQKVKPKIQKMNDKNTIIKEIEEDEVL